MRSLILILIFIMIGGCTVIKNRGVLHYNNIKTTDYHPYKEMDFELFDTNRSEIDSLAVDSLGSIK